ncbi:group III truncated hemoglobin [Streptomyces justiciae]|uniref:Group III truncated hemoglobin n=1 Tax=Streptomyces justiciae TaxID=2780140 RepID=A0ABU3M299_9ACTN|nr:group III truncated hemoglobin [Streptomyces justiciae]MDT7845639.1 group III truncated hemoglobin [Streptomyces justiciae]
MASYASCTACPESGELPDIHDRQDVERLVHAFYGRVFEDPLIGPFFAEVARVDTAVHLLVMADFWQSHLLAPGTYRRNALHAHRELHSRRPLRAEHFERWLHLWTSTIHERHAGPVADKAVRKAQVIARALLNNTVGNGQERPERQPVAIEIGLKGSREVTPSS